MIYVQWDLVRHSMTGVRTPVGYEERLLTGPMSSLRIQRANFTRTTALDVDRSVGGFSCLSADQ